MSTQPVQNTTSAQSPDSPLLRVEDLKTYFHLEHALSRAVDGVSFAINPGQTLGMVGESGCGKSVTALSILQLIPSPPGRIESGQIVFEGHDLLQLPESEMRKIRGNRIGMIFQEPMTSLNPLYCVGDQVGEVLRLHKGASRSQARAQAVHLLEQVGIPSAAERARDYPHHLSGGMRQRVMIAMALACNPALIIADEPTTALDVTVQAQILLLMKQLQETTGAAILLITHDLGVVAETADHVAVMYAGNIVESASVEEIFARPGHPVHRRPHAFHSPHQRDSERRQAHADRGATFPILQTGPRAAAFTPDAPTMKPECKGSPPPARPLSPRPLYPLHFLPRNLRLITHSYQFVLLSSNSSAKVLLPFFQPQPSGLSHAPPKLTVMGGIKLSARAPADKINAKTIGAHHPAIVRPGQIFAPQKQHENIERQ